MPCAIMRGREPAGSVQHARALSEVVVYYYMYCRTLYFSGLRAKDGCEMSLCFGARTSLRTYGGQTARANMRSPIIRNIGRPDREIPGYPTNSDPPPPQPAPTSILCTEPLSLLLNPRVKWRESPSHCASNSKPPQVANFSDRHYRTVGRYH